VKKSHFCVGLTAVFFVIAGNVFAQTIQFEYDVSQKYPIYVMFEGNADVASEMTGWFYDDRSWHFIENEWTWNEDTRKYKYSGNARDNWITDGGERFYMGPDDSAHYYAYLQNKARDWEMFMMNAKDKNVIYATGNEIFDRIDGAPSNSNPYRGTWRSRADSALVAIFDENGQSGATGVCKLTFTNQYKNAPLVGKAAPPAAKAADAVVVRTNSPSSTGASVVSANPTAAGTDATRNALIEMAKKYVGKRYKRGSVGMDTFDCSGFTYTVYKQVTGFATPRWTSGSLAKEGKRIKMNEIKVGDLILFDTEGQGPSHVAMYMGNNEMIHSYNGKSGTQGVTITKMDGSASYKKWWGNNILYGIRVLAN
jgi:cell wall-associated NlpC family hydrolase